MLPGTPPPPEKTQKQTNKKPTHLLWTLFVRNEFCCTFENVLAKCIYYTYTYTYHYFNITFKSGMLWLNE